MGSLSCISCSVSGPSKGQESRIKRGFGAGSSHRVKQASGTRREMAVVPWGGMSPAIHFFMGPVAAVP